MTKRIASLFLVLALCMTFFPVMASAEDGATQPAYSGGAGTQNDPWIISTVDDLMTLARTVNAGENYADKYFRQTADLDLTDKTWEPIGYTDSDYYFSGNYNGDNHVISNAVSAGKEDEDGQATVGIFGCLLEGSVSNLHVRNANFTATGNNAYGHAGGLIGIVFDATITDCSVENSSIISKRLPNNNSCAGSIVGFSVHGTYTNCFSVNNTVTAIYSGGFTGEIDDSYSTNGGSEFTNCYVTKGSVTAFSDNISNFSFAGGFIGELTEDIVTLENCYVYDMTISCAESQAKLENVGVFVGNRYTNLPNYEAKIETKNCFYGKCTTNEEAGTATEKAETEFTDGTVTRELGDAFVQGTNYPVIRISATGITLDKEKISLAVGATQELVATVMPSVATNKNVTWTSDHPEIATVENGVVTAVAAGEATITAKTEDGNNVATCTVTVATPVTAVTLDKTTLSIKRGNTETLTATIEPENASNKNVTWASDNEAVATVDENGVVTAVSAGTANITVTTVDGNKTATCAVTVSNPSSSGNSSSGNTTTKTETTTNPDGSTTKTETKKDGSVTETTTGTDGSVTKTETKTETKSDGSKTETKTETKTDADGNKTTSKTETTTDKSGTVTESKTETKTDADGTKTEVKSETKKDQNGVTTGTETVKETLPNGSTGTTTTTTDANGTKTEAVTTISSKAVDEAKKNDEAVTVPVDVKATEDSQTAPTVKVELPKNSGETKVEIPVSNVTPGTVVAVVKPDGTEEIVKDCIPTENGIQLAVEDNVTLKVFDNAKDFTDTKGHWAEPYIDFASARELLNGISEDTFAPEQPTTRAMMWTVLARQDDTDLSGGTTWYDKAQAWAKDSGVSDGTAPQANVTRAQMVTMLWRAAGSPAPQTMSSFADVSADAYYAAAVAWAAEQGITNGVSATQFQPNGACTRAQIAAFLYRASLEN